MEILNNCPICNSNNFYIYAVKLRFNYPHIVRVRCRNCKNTFSNPMATKVELKQFYTKYYEKGNFANAKENYLKWAKKIKETYPSTPNKELSTIKEYYLHGNFLDIGAGLGISVYYASLINSNNLYATEIDNDAIEFAKIICPEVKFFSGELIQANYPDNYFSYIHFYHVLEHLINPQEYLDEIIRILKPGGICFLATPNISNIGYLIYRIFCFFIGKVPEILDGIEHTIVFSKIGLKRFIMNRRIKTIEHKKERSKEKLVDILNSDINNRKKLIKIIQKLFYINQHIVFQKLN